MMYTLYMSYTIWYNICKEVNPITAKNATPVVSSVKHSFNLSKFDFCHSNLNYRQDFITTFNSTPILDYLLRFNKL